MLLLANSCEILSLFIRLPLPTAKESALMLCKEAFVRDFRKEAVVPEGVPASK